jgi:hypothetical protein
LQLLSLPFGKLVGGRRGELSKKRTNPVNILIAISLLILSVFVVSWLLRTQELSVPVRILLAVIPAALWIFWLVIQLRVIRQSTDELFQRVLLEALAIAYPSVAVAMLAAEYFRKAGFITSLKPDHVLLVMMLFFGIGYFIAWRRYR